jgi:CheY-like chemotaxis protein
MNIGASGVIEKPAEREELSQLFSNIAEKVRKAPTRKPTQRRSAQAKRGAVPERTQAKRGAFPELAGTRILIVDDDIRNIYSLTSVLEAHNVQVLHAERGAEGISILETVPGVDAALVDIMMPEMDGFETMQAIRELPRYRDLPLIAITAKAMKGDREKCIEAGATDYVSKPVDIDQLLAVLRVQFGRSVYNAAASIAPMDGPLP